MEAQLWEPKAGGGDGYREDGAGAVLKEKRTWLDSGFAVG